MSSKQKLSKKDLEHLAKLATLKLNQEELEKYSLQLEKTLKYIENLSELNTADVAPTDQTTNLENVFFTDGEKNTRKLRKEDIFTNTKKRKESYFAVRRVI